MIVRNWQTWIMFLFPLMFTYMGVFVINVFYKETQNKIREALAINNQEFLERLN